VNQLPESVAEAIYSPGSLEATRGVVVSGNDSVLFRRLKRLYSSMHVMILGCRKGSNKSWLF
jgi:hypothetical protein